MTKEELILDKMNSIIEAINEHIIKCPDCHLKGILKSIIGDTIE
jgi:hypothetical protein